MTITAGDVKLLKSQVMDDVTEGGGAPTATVIADASSNSIFPDISELDRAGGRVNLRKVFGAVRTADVDGFYGSNVIVAEPPADPRVSVTLFSTGDVFDRRSSAASRMEAYLARGPVYGGLLFGDHIAGQINVALLQRVEVALPAIGDTLMLRKREGQADQFDQYIRVTKVTSTVRTFTDSIGDFQRLQVVLELSDVLQADFPGFDPVRQDVLISYAGKTKVCGTVVADAARYYGVVPLSEAAHVGDYTVKGASVYTQLVPSTRIETPIADTRLNQQSALLAKAGDSFSRTLTMAFTTAQAMHVGGGMLPGSVSVARGSVTITDKGGLLLDASAAQVGTIDYANGVLTLATNVFGAASGDHAVTYTPAGAPVIVTDTLGLAVTQQSRRLSWVVTLATPPARGSLRVSYRALGRWYVLSDDGSGSVRGSDSAYGAGTMNFTTGTLMLTLGAMPDLGSRIMLAWGSPASVVPLPPPPAPPPPGSIPAPAPGTPSPPAPPSYGVLGVDVVAPLAAGKGLKMGSINLAWNDGSARSAHDVGATLTGDATGLISYSNGSFRFCPKSLPPVGTVVSATAQLIGAPPPLSVTMTDEGANWGFSLSAPVGPNSLSLTIEMTIPMRHYPGVDADQKVLLPIRDDGVGTLIRPDGTSVGSIDYGTGAGHFLKTTTNYLSYQPLFEGYDPEGGVSATGVRQVGNGVRQVTGQIGSALTGTYGGPSTSEDVAWNFTVSLVKADVVPPASVDPTGLGAPEKTVALSSIQVGTGGSAVTYQTNGSQLQSGVSPSTGTGTVAGSVSGGSVALSSWPTGASSTLAAAVGVVAPVVMSPSGAASPGTAQVCGSATLRTAISPLVVGGFSIAGAWLDGAMFTVNATGSGTLATGGAPTINPDPAPPTPGTRGVFGVVDFDTGIADLYFGQRVPDSMAGGVGVVDVSALGLPGVNYLLLSAVQADSLRYNAVGYSYLPLDPALLGLNPVRLPPDGRVPIFRKGSFAVLGNTQIVAAATYTAGDTVNCGRTRLSRLRVIGADGVVIPGGYTVNLDSGVLTVTSTAGWAQPVTVEHRVEDMMLVSDVQINGQLSFTRPVTHDYAAGTSYISSALVAGDIHARVSVLFDQATWGASAVWADSVAGDPAAPTFNDAQYPVSVTNRSALTERWAVVFTNSTSFNVMGEHVGVIATGNTSTDCAPVNPNTGQPYFTIPAAGWGLGWAVGMALRFNTVGALIPVWMARTILQGPETVPADSFTMLLRGDVDQP